MAWFSLRQKRFVEALIRYSDHSLKVKYISVPLLLQSLARKDQNAYNKLMTRFTYFINTTRVFEGKDTDRSENEIVKICPNLMKKDIRKFSYAVLLYREVRSGLVHESRITDLASARPMHKYSNSVSYNNIAELFPVKMYHSIHFPYEWIEKLVLSLQNKLMNSWEKFPSKEPSNWWIEGI